MASSSHNDAPADGGAAHIPPGPGDERNPYASANKWRHAESSAYAKYEKAHHQHQRHPVAREANARSAGVSDLADFLNKSRIDPRDTTAAPPSSSHGAATTPKFKPVVAGATEARAITGQDRQPGDEEAAPSAGPPPDGKEIVCGPLINYRRMEGARWVGSVLVVTAGGGRTQPIVPRLELRKARAGGEGHEVEGFCLYSDPRNTFWRFDVEVEMEQVETEWEYEMLGDLRYASATKPRVNRFFVPAADESMRIMFHSCNGFSVGTDEEAFSGAALWNDVMRRHKEAPFHVM